MQRMILYHIDFFYHRNNEEDKLSKLAEIVEDADSLANFKSPSSNSWKVFNSSLVIEEQSFNDMEIYLTSITRMYPDITSLYSIGKSTEGRDLWVMEISDNPGSHEPGWCYVIITSQQTQNI